MFTNNLLMKLSSGRLYENVNKVYRCKIILLIILQNG